MFINYISFNLKRIILMFIFVGTVGCQSQQSPFPSGHYTIVDGELHTYMLVERRGYVLYKICTKLDGNMQEIVLDRGEIIKQENGFTYTSNMGGPIGILTPNGDGYLWKDLGGDENGEMNAGWPASYNHCKNK